MVLGSDGSDKRSQMGRIGWFLILLSVAGCRVEAPPPSVPAGQDIHLPPDTTIVRGIVPRRTTLDVMLRGHGVADGAIADIVAAVRTVFDPRRLRSLQPFSLERTFEGALRVFEYRSMRTDFFESRLPRSAPSRSAPRCCRSPRRWSMPLPPVASTHRRHRLCSQWRPQASE